MSVSNHFVRTLPVPARPNKQYYASVEKYTCRHQSVRRGGRKHNLLKNVMFDSQEYCQDRPQGLKRKKNNIQKLGLDAAQCNGIAACAYYLKNILTVWYLSN